MGEGREGGRAQRVYRDETCFSFLYFWGLLLVLAQVTF